MGGVHMGGQQQQRQRCRHGMGWVPILQWQRQRQTYIYMYLDVAVAALPPSVNTCNDVVAVAVTPCEGTFIITYLSHFVQQSSTLQINRPD